MTRILLPLAAAGALLLSSCETTGDPSQGGLFGWSQAKANDRIAEKQDQLNQVQQDNAYQQGRTDVLQQTAAQKQAQLNQQQ